MAKGDKNWAGKITKTTQIKKRINVNKAKNNRTQKSFKTLVREKTNLLPFSIYIRFVIFR